MEPINKLPSSVKGIEVLYFPDAELQKCKGGSVSFASTGSLHVLYFKDYDRFVLTLNNWYYPLLRRIPVIGLDKDEKNSRSYSLPTLNGFCFIMRINLTGSDVPLENFETILQDNSRFSWKGEAHHGKLAQSPDDKLVRHPLKDTGIKEKISETFKHGVQSVKNKIETMKTGTSNLTSRRKKLDLKSIKNKNFKKTAHSKLKKEFLDSSEKMSQEFLKLRTENINLILARSYEELKKTSDAQAPSLYFNREEIEEAILDNKDLANKGNFDLVGMVMPTTMPSVSKPSMTEALREGMRDIKDTVAGRRDITDRNVTSQLPGQTTTTSSKLPGFEGMTHYQG